MNHNVTASFSLSVLTVLTFAVALYEPDRPAPRGTFAEPVGGPAIEVVEARPPTEVEEATGPTLSGPEAIVAPPSNETKPTPGVVVVTPPTLPTLGRSFESDDRAANGGVAGVAAPPPKAVPLARSPGPLGAELRPRPARDDPGSLLNREPSTPTVLETRPTPEAVAMAPLLLPSVGETNPTDRRASSRPPTPSIRRDLPSGAPPALRNEPKPALSPAAPMFVQEPPGDFVKARPGETLADIAARAYGDRDRAEALWRANRDTLDRPDGPVPEGALLRAP